jgi:hypothetical protein
VVLYELLEDGSTLIRRLDAKGNELDRAEPGHIQDMQGLACLPVIPAGYGEHPDIPNLGSGLLMNLTDIVIDLYNTVTEIRESYRNSAFTALIYRGGNGDEVQEQLESGSMFVDVDEEGEGGRSLREVMQDGEGTPPRRAAA